MRIALSVLAVLSAFTIPAPAFEIAYFTSLRNDAPYLIEVTPDPTHGHTRYMVERGQTLTFLGGFSTVKFSVHTPPQTFYYSFPFTFGAKPTRYKGRQKHSYVFTREHQILPIGPDGAIVRQAKGFPLLPHET